MANTEQVFHCFPRLPADLRKEIWRFCLPNRICELDFLVDDIVFNVDEGAPVPCTLERTTSLNSRPPLITRVCREAREVALETGYVHIRSEDDRPETARWVSMLSVEDGWQDRTRDSWHLNYNLAYEGGYESSGHPVAYLAWHVLHSASGVGSFDFGLLSHVGIWSRASDPFGVRHKDECHSLKQLQKWLVVMRIIVVHADLRTAAATGMFGLLGDATLQVVDVADQGRLEKFVDLAEEYEKTMSAVVTPQDLTRESKDSMELRLQEVEMDGYGNETMANTLRPAVTPFNTTRGRHLEVHPV
ncbi:hypothetical protein LTS14_000897 [Recurvomyces mirabilis]|uniref:uncharacterized protein n=1 Tax=Recurvomyces mirabilis TaxID=574656 RepID=UPI002DE013DD|nr:hypothetical protein LTS14_000897 [Recurvomyces mirabilis]